MIIGRLPSAKEPEIMVCAFVWFGRDSHVLDREVHDSSNIKVLRCCEGIGCSFQLLCTHRHLCCQMIRACCGYQ